MTKTQAATATATATCQLCGRSVGLYKNGTIAHHGYILPAPGMKSAPCKGSSKPPYEISCGAIQPEIDRMAQWAETSGIALDEMKMNPPDILSNFVKSGFGKKQSYVTFSRPEGFNPAKETNGARANYENFYFADLKKIDQNIKVANAERSRLQERLNNWKPAAPAAE